METSAQRSFAINPGTIKLPLSDKRAGEVTVTVTNSSQAFKKGFVRYVPLGATDPAQKRPDLVIDGEKERPFEKGAAQQFKIKVSAKPDVKEGPTSTAWTSPTAPIRKGTGPRVPRSRSRSRKWARSCSLPGDRSGGSSS